MEPTAICPGCKIGLPKTDMPTHRYLGASPSCWQVYGSVLAKEYSDPHYMKFHRWTVDAYAAQHPGQPNPQTIQSINVHLFALHALLERKIEASEVPPLMSKLEKFKDQFTWFEPPQSFGDLTVLDLTRASSPEEHGQISRKWAESVWNSWNHAHGRVATLSEKAINR